MKKGEKKKQTRSLFDKDGQRKYLNEKERKKFEENIKHLSKEKQLFCLAIYWTGARISEVLNINPEHIDFSDKVVIVRSLKKRGKIEYRHILVPPFYLKELALHVKELEKGSPIWTFSRRTASRYVKKLMTRSGITGSRACARGLRHSYAVHYVINDAPLPLVKKWMGHVSIETTIIYTQIIGEEERKIASRSWTK